MTLFIRKTKNSMFRNAIQLRNGVGQHHSICSYKEISQSRFYSKV